MSLRITCPNCGTRPVHEFNYGEVPSPPADLTDADDIDFDRAFMRNNTEGVQTEAWFHVYGCRRWTYLKRDTVTDTVIEVLR